MKKVRITPKPGSGLFGFNLFTTSVAAYVSATQVEGVMLQEDDTQCDKVVVHENEFSEIEWCGCEFVYNNEDKTHTRFDLVRCIVVQIMDDPSKTPIVSTYEGWTEPNAIPFTPLEDEDFLVVDISKQGHTEYDMESMFQQMDDEDNQTQDDDDNNDQPDGD